MRRGWARDSGDYEVGVSIKTFTVSAAQAAGYVLFAVDVVAWVGECDAG